MSKKLKLGLLAVMTGVIMLMAGCVDPSTIQGEPITAETEGFWSQYFVWPLAWLLKEAAYLIGGTWQYGYSIIVATIIVRLLILPLMIKQTKSMGAMQVLQPEMLKLREKYSSKDQETQRKLQEEMMKMYQEYQINPLAGCLPILIQMPILFAFYDAIRRTPEIFEAQFLWFDLGAPDPTFILPILAAILTFVQQKISMAGQEQNPQLKMMLYIFPVMIFVMSITLPAALSMYWVVGYIISIIVTMAIMLPMREKMKVQAEAKIAAKEAERAVLAEEEKKAKKKKRK
ncbi:MAG: membrane protein insertase YidC [Exiguobacterium chiriqhucha]|jgi:YidC/Oxa1 family membrane protein insertase|uniref:Membrane protein insertase YidC n=1 Tax=Exiguobacterium chiriqhucha RW-2 TaxID=1345023 RepID=U1LEH3_9BACL|nr:MULTISPECIES: membrane protein insertase YidC [Exiguobacterium]ERG65663.1 membrane protein [Exiguobacterium chiriqhucha RW-2]TCI69748.1 membrane protein insertase YidC [Exiguobacterium sp. IPCI3]TCI79046.1 membrane protein insertase YidC [Exiguobacterium sp. IPCH1]TCI81633.1 membrane protein insertase YidC [Exiguobacterium sp. IPBC4]